MLIRLYRYFALRPYWITLLIATVLVLWMLSGLANSSVDKEQTSDKSEQLPKVQVTRYIPEIMTKSLNLYGRSEANSRVIIRSEAAGKVVKLFAEKGNYVQLARKLAGIDKNALPQQLAQAEALYAERLLNFNAIKSLNDKGLQDRSRLAQVKSLLLAALSRVKQLQLQLQHTEVSAPFAGVLQEQFVESGDFLQVGDPLFTIEALDPIIIRGDITEHYLNQLRLGQNVSATLLSGKQISGKISYIASHADPQSSTFRIEASFANPDFSIVSGVSARLAVPLYPVQAIYVSPSTLALDDQGNLGIKSVQDGIVVFKNINLVEADNDGVWLGGFSEPVDIITLGQGFVKPGDHVLAVAAEK